MPDGMKLTQTRIRGGVWEGVLTGAGGAPPKLKVPIPAEVLSEGVQTLLVRHGSETLAHFTIITGVAMEDDVRAEIDLLRAELDMLKRAFRRHCLETMG